ncbi:unnamed protein product, partial [marine sediment metagenome]
DELWHRGLHGRGHRLTIPRKAILEVLSNSDDHVSAEDIYMVVHQKYPAIGLTTVYRTLDILVQMGIVFKFDFGDGRARYELTEGFSDKKHHFVNIFFKFVDSHNSFIKIMNPSSISKCNT